VTAALVASGLLLSFAPGAADALQYDRGAVGNLQLWRPLTGQLVHWTPRMTLVDLGAILILGIWLEMRSRRLLVASTLGAACLVAAGLHFFLMDLSVYRGSSGLASALFLSAALLLLSDRRLAMWWRGLALVALLLFLSKIMFEIVSGAPLAAGHFPTGVRVTPAVHLLGAAAGAAAWAALGPRIE
jgi:rhomboid family GlyGly-CTERM serine protease